MKSKIDAEILKKYGASAYNTALDELPENYSRYSPNMWLWLLQIMLMIFSTAIMVLSLSVMYSSVKGLFFLIGLVLVLCICGINIALSYAKKSALLFLIFLCLLYIALPAYLVFNGGALFNLLPIFLASLVLLIIQTKKFEEFFSQRESMMEWRREQLEKNKVRRAVIKD